jgi:hypothetical protein
MGQADFGWLDTTLPHLAYLALNVLIIAVLVLAFMVATRRERVVLAGILAGVVVSTIALSLFLQAQGIGRQGRYFLPVWVLVPLYGAEILRRGAPRLGRLEPTRFPVAGGATIAVVQAVALFANGRRYAVGTGGTLLYFGRGHLAPPFGWWFWIAPAMAGAALLAAGAAAVPLATPRRIGSGRISAGGNGLGDVLREGVARR